MFEESLLESAHLLPRQSRWTTAASFGVQVAIAAIIIAIPLLHPGVLPLHAAEMTLTAPAPIPPPLPRVQRINADTASSAMTVPTVQTMLQPLLGHPISTNAFSDDPPTGTNLTMVGSGNTVGNSLMASATNGTPNVVVATPAKPGPPTRISQGVSAGLLLAPIQPTYPRMAIVTHTEGTVIIHAIISKEGRVESANVLSGPIMLQTAALEAVRNAHYRPYRLSGEPTEVETTFNISFHLGSS